MTEWVDVYDRDLRPTGAVRARGEPLGPGEFVLAVGVWPMNAGGELLVTRRAPEKDFAPGLWENTGGHVQAGETPEQAILRELQEETGIVASAEQLVFLGTTGLLDHGVGFNYGLRVDVPVEEIRLQPGETDAARWVTFEQLRAMKAAGMFAPSVFQHLAGYQEAFLAFIGHPGEAL